MFENFPYADLQQLNLDWIIKIAKDFLDQYTHIQQIITDGLEELDTETQQNLQALDDKKTQLEALLDEWYNTHSQDIANDLQAALSELQATLLTLENDFDIHADQKAAAALATIPDDYTELISNITVMNNSLLGLTTRYNNTDLWEKGGLTGTGGNDNYRINCRARNISFIKFDRGLVINSANGTNAQCSVKIKNADGTITDRAWATSATINPGEMARIMLDNQYNSASPVNNTVEQILSSFTFTENIAALVSMVQPYPYSITDGQLSIMGVNHISGLPKNRIYNLNNVNIGGIPSDLTAPISGALVCLESVGNGWPMYIMVTNSGLLRTGTGIGTNMRWSEGNNVERYYTLITDSVLSAMNVSNIRDLPKNKIYSLSNVSALNDLPTTADNPFNGFLVCFGTISNGWSGYVLINNYGITYTGTSTTTETRWDYEKQPLTRQISDLTGKNVVLVGDSIMYGSHVSDAAPGSRVVITIRGTSVYENTSRIVWTHGFMDYLVDNYNCTVLNQSFPGCSFNDVTNNLATLIPSGYDYAIIMLGVNDWGNPGSVATHIKTINLYCQNNGITPIFVTPPPAREYVDELAKIRLNIMAYQNEIADFYTLFSEYIDYKNIPLAIIMDDLVHYNDAGQPHILTNVIHCLHL